MKKLMFILAVLMLALPMAAKDKYSRNATDLPMAAQSMIKQQFPTTAVNHIKIESDFRGVKGYDVILNNGVEIEFDANGNWEDIDCGHSAVPSSLVPKSISAYVQANHKGQKIVKIEKSPKRYEVELLNGIELLFDKNGNFTRYDK